MDIMHNKDTDILFKAVLKLETVEECYKFFADLCTVGEVNDMAQRLRVAIMLSEGKRYLEICDETGASTATISRVNRCLTANESGYKSILKKIKG